jgi:methylenetetrahydrofolate dehydrogenase (NADP+)/methenyltetrahydrofolate cyclohydrolase
MPAQLIKGTEISKQIKEELAARVKELKEKHNLVPGLATILVGEDPASQVYVGSKRKTCEQLGIKSFHTEFPADISQDTLLKKIDELNRNEDVHGILVQLPLPKHLSETEVLYAIDPDKDVDGFHPVNVGRLVTGDAMFLPCTPHGVQQMLMRKGIQTKGKHVVVVGRSNIVGKPVANILLQKKEGANATVTVCHTGSHDLGYFTRMADILIVAVGKAKAVTADMVREGAVVIDVGVNRIGKTAEGKAILAGDVDFDAVKEKASYITPVPGGVGPMTITMLMMNTVRAAEARIK